MQSTWSNISPLIKFVTYLPSWKKRFSTEERGLKPTDIPLYLSHNFNRPFIIGIVCTEHFYLYHAWDSYAGLLRFLFLIHSSSFLQFLLGIIWNVLDELFIFPADFSSSLDRFRFLHFKTSCIIFFIRYVIDYYCFKSLLFLVRQSPILYVPLPVLRNPLCEWLEWMVISI